MKNTLQAGSLCLLAFIHELPAGEVGISGVRIPEYTTKTMSHKIIDTFHPAVHLSGDILCDLLGAGEGTSPDFICSAFSFEETCTDEEYLQFNNTTFWYHHDGNSWIKTEIARGLALGVGRAVLDVTGDGKLDVIVGEWHHPYIRGDVRQGGNLYLIEQPVNPFSDTWPIHRIGTGHKHLHDMVTGDLDGDGKPEILLRNKHHQISWIKPCGDPRETWREYPVVAEHPGDGTAIHDVTGDGCMDIVTGNGFFQNVRGDGTEWKFHSFGIGDLNLHAERRVAVADMMGDESISVILSESEVSQKARIYILTTHDNGVTWARKEIISASENCRALHTLRLRDVTGNGKLDIFTAEMEHMDSYTSERMPRWYCLENKGNLEFEKHVILNAALGAHHARLGRIQKDGPLCMIGNDWKRNEQNACGGRNHITVLELPGLQ